MATRETYDRNGNVIATEYVPDVPQMLRPLDLVLLFKPAELLALEQSTNLFVVSFRTQFFSAIEPIALDDPRFTGAVAIMQQLGILTAERAASVLGNQQPS